MILTIGKVNILHSRVFRDEGRESAQWLYPFVLNFSSPPAMTCDETPDDGSGSGVYNTTWNNLKIYRTNITYTCPVGQAFDTIYNQTVNNTCNYQTQDAAQVSWTYSGATALPPCIRKYQTNCLIMCYGYVKGF